MAVLAFLGGTIAVIGFSLTFGAWFVGAVASLFFK